MQESSLMGGPLAAIDMGSNSFRLELGQLQHGRYRRVDYLKETVRLGAGLDGEGLLTEEAVERGLACLRRFAGRLAGFAPAQVRAVATQTLREARNRDAFLQRAQAVLGYPIEVISGREEARLIYAGVARLQPADEPRLVIDIGGRSTELILGQGRVPLVAESFAVGCVGLSMRFFEEGRITAAGFREAQVAAGAELEEAMQPFAPEHWRRALGSSGTAGAVSQLLLAAGVTDGRITPAGLQWCIERCIEAGHRDRLQLPGLKPDRRAVLPGGLAILYTLAANFDIDTLWPAKGALRQGVIIDLHERIDARRRARAGDMRDNSVRELQRRFGVDTAQAERVAGVALALFDAALPEADDETRRELGWACALHEIGLMVSHHDHHRHSAYVLAHVDAPGFSQSQQRRIGELVLGQRGGLRKIETSLTREDFTWQLLCLRLGVIKCHARGDVSADAMRLKRTGSTAELGFAPGWSETHPRTRHLLNEEAAMWERGGPLRLVLRG
ncbi:MAG: Ppx/GppA family phosphatase [Burkholderiales bacterium]|nr:Ppx/GppA family phosphatase [Burkholderiales bacterium]